MRLLRTSLFAFLLLPLLSCGKAPSPTSPDPASMPFLSRRIFAPDPNDTIVDLMPLRMQMREYAKTIPEPFGMYFEYLPSGASIGINDTVSFIEASLLKVPVVIKAYQLEDAGLLSLDDVVTMQEQDMDQNFGDLWQRGVGTKLTVRELIRITLQESDNTALQMLGRRMGEVSPGFVNEVFDYLDVPKELGNDGVLVSAKNYTSILRSLYLAASVPKNDAQEILSILTQTKYNDQLPAGVPPVIKVAHKMGVYEKGDAVTYADCGIVYVPRRPYSLCVFVHANEANATKYIKEFSRMAYDFISEARSTSYNER